MLCLKFHDICHVLFNIDEILDAKIYTSQWTSNSEFLFELIFILWAPAQMLEAQFKLRYFSVFFSDPFREQLFYLLNSSAGKLP